MQQPLPAPSRFATARRLRRAMGFYSVRASYELAEARGDLRAATRHFVFANRYWRRAGPETGRGGSAQRRRWRGSACELRGAAADPGG